MGQKMCDARRKAPIAEKLIYSRAAQKRLSEVEFRLTGVGAKIRSATAAGHIVTSRQLIAAQRAVDANLAVVKARLESLRKSTDTVWKEHARDVDTAWEDLFRSIKKLVAGYSEGERSND